MKKSQKKSQGLIYAMIGIGVILALAAGIFLTLKPANESETAFLAKHGLSGLTVEEIVQKLDSTTADPAGLQASITSDALVLMDDASEVKLALPKDKFYLSFAPYVNRTHPCGTHSLSSCQGELVGKEVRAVITDSAGQEVVNASLTTMENGFIGVWLPRDMKGAITVSYDGMAAQAPITTFSGSDTCLTTPLQLN